MVPDWAWTWCLVLGGITATGGVVMGLVYLGWWVDSQIDLLSVSRRAEEKRMELQADHNRKLLELELRQKEALAFEIAGLGEKVA